MKRTPVVALAALLILALGAIAWLLHRVRGLERALADGEARWAKEREELELKTRLPRVIPEEWEETGAPAIPVPESTGDPLADARARVAALEREIAEAKSALSRFDGMDPSIALVYADGDLRGKLVEMAGLAEAQRWQTVWLLGSAVGTKPERAAEALRLLESEQDPAVLGMLGLLLRAGALRSLDGEALPRVLSVLAGGQPAERRSAAAWAVQPSRWEREGGDWGVRVAAAVRAETDPTVLGVLARSLDAGVMSCPDEVLDAYRGAAQRMPAGEARRDAYTLLGKAAFLRDEERALFDEWAAAGDQGQRDDLAHALASAAGSMGGGGPEGNTAEERERNLAQARTRFRTVYGGTSDLRVRHELLRAAPYGFGLMGANGASDAAFLAELATQERDPALRDRLGRLSEAAGRGVTLGTKEWDEILGGKGR